MRPLAALASLLAGGLLLSACANPTVAPRTALEEFLVDVQAHSAVYAYTQLTNPAENQTSFLPFFNGVNSTNATFKVVRMKVVSAAEVTGTVEVMNQGQADRYVIVQMLEEGNAGDWLVADPFSSEGAKAIKLFQ
jgi:hypothetical protein